MSNINDLTGKRFGKLKVISIASMRPTIWKCECDCGNTVNVRAQSLVNGCTKSCGCLKVGAKPRDITGQKFGKLTAVRLADEQKGHGAWWVCECECGNTCIARADSLKNGNTRSCGCMRKERWERERKEKEERRKKK